MAQEPNVRSAKHDEAVPCQPGTPLNEFPPFYYVNAVWGSSYVDLFTEFSIPTLLAPGNIPGTANRDVSEFVIVTTPPDAECIRSAPIFASLSERIKVVFVYMEITGGTKYNQMTYGHNVALDYVARRGFCVFLAPDALIADGMMQRLLHLVAQGRRVVLGFGPRVEQAAMVRDLRNASEYQEDMPLALSSRRLVQLSMPNLHQDSAHHFFDSAFFPERPYACIWPSSNRDGMLVRALNLHPYLFDSRLIPEGERLDYQTMAIDWNLVPLYVTDWNDVYVEKDSDNICIVGMTPAEITAKPSMPNRLDPESLSLWVLRHKYEFLNRSSFLYPIVFHSQSLDAHWDELVHRSGEFALKVIDPARQLRNLTLWGHAVAKDIKDGHLEPNKAGASMLNVKASESNSESMVCATPPTAKNAIPFFYGFTVWGERYVDYLCRFAVTSLLAPRNIPSLSNNHVSKFVIATTPADETRIRSHDAFDVLSRMIDVEFVYLPISGDKLPSVADHPAKYNLLSVGHSLTADRAAGRGCALFLGPDAIYSDGMLVRLYELIESGKEVVVGMGPRVNEETIVPELVELGMLKEAEPLIARPRHAVELMLRHLHHDARLLRWSSPFFPYPPYMCIWDIGGGDGILLRTFSLHPYIMDYRSICGSRPRPEETSAVDASFLMNCMIPWNKIYQVTDTDDFVVLSLTSMHHKDYVGAPTRDPLAALVASSQRYDITPLHRAYFMNAIKMHVGDLDSRWMQLEGETLKIAHDICSIHAPPPHQITAEEVNQALAGTMNGISGRLAVRLVIKKLGRRLMRR